MEHYADAFHVQPGKCLRMIHSLDGSGRPEFCPYPVEWRGRFQDGTGKWHQVEACEGHADDLVAARRVRPPDDAA